MLSDEGASYKIYNLVFPGLEWGAEAEAGGGGCPAGESFDSGQLAGRTINIHACTGGSGCPIHRLDLLVPFVLRQKGHLGWGNSLLFHIQAPYPPSLFIFCTAKKRTKKAAGEW
ncbi:hypothetical protein [Halalkalibaculum sp. DA3122]|uniref:hypothetical protein n=1 Tax=Halalkalibaculum sp. DA3122 TaxID=3373607 RepID=UPI0037552D3A